MHLLVGVSVGAVEAAGETAHHFKVWVLLCCVDDFLGLYERWNVSSWFQCLVLRIWRTRLNWGCGLKIRPTYHFGASRERLLAKSVLASFNCLDCLLGMHYSCRCNHNGNQTFMLEHVIVVLIQGHAKGFEVNLGPFELGGVGRAGGHKFSSGSTLEEVQGMALAHTA